MPISFPMDLLLWQLLIQRKGNWQNAPLCIAEICYNGFEVRSERALSMILTGLDFVNLFINYRMPLAIFLLTVAVLGIRSHAWMDHFCCKNTECMHVENSLLFETRRVMGLICQQN